MNKSSNKIPTAYEFSCGGIHRTESRDEKVSVTIWREHGCYHVRFVSWPDGKYIWKSYNKRCEAVEIYKKISKAIQAA